MKNDDLVTIARYGTSIEAHLARTFLENAGVESYVADEQAVSMMPNRDIAWGGVKLQVAASNQEKALELLGDKVGSMFNPWGSRPIGIISTRVFWFFWRTVLIICLLSALAYCVFELIPH